MDNDDFVLYQQGGEIISGGYSINSLFLREGTSPMKTLNNNLNGGAKNNDVSNSLDSFAIPAGLFYINQKKNKNYEENHKGEKEKEKEKDKFNKQHNMLPDDIYDKLFQLIQYNKKTKQTKKNKQKSSFKKTKRNNKQ